ncbi:MAG: sulfurtransferase [Phenylobacterium sp.]|uniref:sulfurtransferase n=1 Tax=Phenylobacterium sp. TaxID=1871053 RepID=UPI0012224CFD|nr:sulfurtransferase [Phenylobacterium sp.]TAL29354.1 MAG: sulfurtransferase [Phenylobacterium sp.]
METWDGRGLVSADWLQAHLNDSDLRLFDVTVHLRPATPGPYRIESGRADYETAHIPGAAFLDLAAELSDTSSALNFTHLPADRLAVALGQAGIGGDHRVVAYSSTTPMWATRFWWMLRAAGFENVAILDGGLPAWMAAGRPVEAEIRKYAPTAAPGLADRPGAWADRSDVLAAIGDGGVCTINALAASVHSGESSTNYGRKGHIKGSVNVPYAGLVDAQGCYVSDARLRELFDGVGALQKARVICYCGGGISATMDALALTRLGHPSVAVYDGSMSEWTRDPDLPMETGA